MSAFTCITCRVVFTDGEVQRAHYKTDWHRYNLKRKVADLPPVTAENFKQRVLEAQKTKEPESGSQGCDVCGKFFNSENQLHNHLKSKKHREAESKALKKSLEEEENENEVSEVGLQGQTSGGKADTQQKQRKKTTSQGSTAMEEGETDSDVESVDSFGDEEGLGIEECLFCSEIGKSLEDNVQHMTAKHSFFMPDAEFISDLEGLITYLGQKVGEGHVCLWCNEKGKSFHSTKSVQQHMMDKGHCKILHEGDVLLEYTDFYDYRTSYPDYKPEEGAGGDKGEEEMETDVDPDVLASEGYELVLPSGATIGHRSLHKYYKQNINPKSADRTKSMLPRMLAQYKALGWVGATGPVAERRRKDMGAVQRMKNKFNVKVSLKKNVQFHYRPQVVF